MPTYPGQSPTLTVEAMLRRPQLLARDLTALTSKRFVTDYVFAHGTPDQIAGGAAQYQRSENIYLDRNVEEIALRSEFPRSGWSEAIFTALVKKYGLEVPIAFESIRRNQLDQVARATRKLANSLTKFVDTAAMTLLTTDAAVQTQSAGATWSQSATTIIADLANARKKVADQDEGYEIDTMILNGAQEFAMLVNSDIRGALPRENPNQQMFSSGRVMPLMGLSQILVTPTLTAGTVLFVNSKVVGTVADERPEAGEGYVTYDVGAAPPGGAFSPNAGGLNALNQAPQNFLPIYVKVYNEDKNDDRIVRGARWPAMWLAEPKAAVVQTGS